MINNKIITYRRDQLNFKTELLMLANSIMECEMEGENKFGKIFPFTKVIGLMIRPMEWEDLFMQMAKFTLASGKMIRLMEWAYICIKMDLNMLEIGSKMHNMALVDNNGWMGPHMKENIKMG